MAATTVISQVGEKVVCVSTQGYLGVSAITGYTSTFSGGGTVVELAQLSKHGVFWSQPFDPTNVVARDFVLSELNIGARDVLYFRVEFELTAGPATTIDSFGFTFTQDTSYISNVVYNETSMSKFLTIGYEEHQTEWVRSVLNQMYKRIVPKYIERTENMVVDSEDQDFLDFFRANAVYFSMFVKYARVFEDFYETEVLLSEYLEQRGMFLCRNESLEVLQYLARNFYNEIRRRGTDMPLQRWTDPVSAQEVYGEILRMICWEECDDVVWNVNRPVRDLGWNMDVQSPLYRGVTQVSGFRKYEKEPFRDISLYPTTGAVSINGDDELEINTSGGMGGNNVAFAVPVNPCYTYEIYFEYCPDSQTAFDITVGAFAFDDSGTQIDFLQINNGVTTNNYGVNAETIASPRFEAGNYYPVRMIIYGKETDETTIEQRMLYPDDGYNLKFQDGMCQIIPQIQFDGVGIFKIRNFHVGISSVGFGRGFVQSSPLVEAILFNRNSRMTNEELQYNLRKYFINYHSGLVLIPGDCSLNDTDETYWEATEPVGDEFWQEVNTQPAPIEWIWDNERLGNSDLGDIWPGMP